MRRLAAALVLILTIGLSSSARAHKLSPRERGILQLRPDSTQLLYEILIPPGAAAAHWRVLFDLDRNGRLSDDEYQALARGLAETFLAKLTLKLEGNVIPFQIVDAKVTSTWSQDGYSGRLAALVLLQTREIPQGERKLELSLSPIVDSTQPAVIRLEATEADIESVRGAVQLRMEDGAIGVKIREGTHCIIMVNVPAPKKPAGH